MGGFVHQPKRDTMNLIRVMGAPAVLLLAVTLNHTAAAHYRHGYYQRSHHTQSSHQHIAYRPRSSVVRSPDAGCTLTNDGRKICGVGSQPNRAVAAHNIGYSAYASADEGSLIGARPDDCPHAYCGCGLRKYLGLADVRLNLAHNWARLFPREAAPRSGLAAVRAHHVMYIEAAQGNGEWLIRDYNSGGGLSRLHVRDLRGYIFVNPHG